MKQLKDITAGVNDEIEKQKQLEKAQLDAKQKLTERDRRRLTNKMRYTKRD